MATRMAGHHVAAPTIAHSAPKADMGAPAAGTIIPYKNQIPQA